MASTARHRNQELVKTLLTNLNYPSHNNPEMDWLSPGVRWDFLEMSAICKVSPTRLSQAGRNRFSSHMSCQHLPLE